ncbi:MAG TPA: lipopolysaccharide heptosyltransferase II [Anaerolineaceae bacterium]|nr:lipopolysaccharide heptosyltransferase II [Anaerolineaceae bacterium]
MSIHPDWGNVRRLLAVRLDSMGDVLMTTPAIRAIKESIPGVSITLLTSKSGAEVAQMVPEIDEAIVYAAPWMKASPSSSSSQIDHSMIDWLIRERFDAAVIFTVFSQNPWAAALLCYLADIPLRLAYSRENPYGLLNPWIKETEPSQGIRHEVQRQIDLVAEIGAMIKTPKMRIAIPIKHDFTSIVLQSKYGLDFQSPWAILHCGATAPSRRYSPQGFAEIAQILYRQGGFQIVFTGSTSELELVDFIQKEAKVPSINLAGKISLPELAALIQKAPVLISNNSGPVHLAAALGTPVVDLYALTNPQHTPWKVPNRVLYHDVPCKYCYQSVCPQIHHHCLSLVTPQMVVAAVNDLLAEVRSSTMQEETTI